MLLRMLMPLACFAALSGSWELYCHMAMVPVMLLPPPTGVIRALWAERGQILPHALSTSAIALAGFTLSTGFALAASVLLHFLPRARQGLMPLFVASQTVPLVALAPLMILWFGFGLLPKILLVILVTFFPILLSLLSAYRSCPGDYTDLLRAMGAGPWQVFRRASFPAARAGFLAGLRISGTYAIVATIFAEYAGARQGLGIYILAAKNNFRADLVLAAVVVSALLTLSLLGLIRLIERITAPGPGGLSHG